VLTNPSLGRSSLEVLSNISRTDDDDDDDECTVLDLVDSRRDRHRPSADIRLQPGVGATVLTSKCSVSDTVLKKNPSA